MSCERGYLFVDRVSFPARPALEFVYCAYVRIESKE
jgi:hypothetical protein